jgi:hypothetical protein
MIDRSVAVDELALRQHGLITSSQAIEALGPSRKARWVKERRLISVQPTVFRLAGAPETWHQSLLATSLAVDGIVSHRSAAELWDLIEAGGYVEVSVATAHTRTVRPPAIVHRVKDLRPGLSVNREGLRVTDPVRTIIDLGLVIPAVMVRAAIARGLSTRLFTIADVQVLRDALGRPGRNGTGIVRDILEGNLVSLAKEESGLEARFGRLSKRFGLPALVLQHEVWSEGHFVARADAAYPEIKLAIEIDGFAHHSTPDAFQADRTRQNRLVALGWTVLRFTWTDIVKHPAEVARVILETRERLLASA